MLVNKASDRDWKPTDYPGIERSLFRNNDTGGRSSVVRLVQGSRFPQHAHHGTEEVVVLSGLVSIGGVSLSVPETNFNAIVSILRASGEIRLRQRLPCSPASSCI